MQPMVTFGNYEKIVDEIYPLGQGYTLRFNVILSRRYEDGTRHSFHTEYTYNSNKYSEPYTLVTLKRQFECYLSIEGKDEFGDKEFIMIRMQDMIIVQNNFNRALNWLNASAEIFGKYKGNLVVVNRPEPIVIRDLALGKYIMLEPVILTYNNMPEMGVRMTLSADDRYIDITFSKYMGLVYLLNNMNMYLAAQEAVNYLQRPAYGTNMTHFGNSRDFKEPVDRIESNTTRKIQSKNKQRSYFDKIDEM